MVNKDGSPMSQTRFTAALTTVSKRLLGKELSNNAFRHIFITDFLSKNPSLNEKIRVMRLCGQVYKPNSADIYQKNCEEEDEAISDPEVIKEMIDEGASLYADSSGSDSSDANSEVD